MKLLYIAQESWEEAYIKEKLPDVEFVAKGSQDAEALCVFIDHKIDTTELARYPHLKLIATRSTGFDHIDLAEAKRRGIVVTSVPSYGVNTVAEFAFALILALSRRVCEARAHALDGTFSQKGLGGFDLAGKTLGLVGCGHIGVHTATIARGFGMEVLVYDVVKNDELAHKTGFAYVSLEDALSRADIISIHVPYNTHTHHLINAQNISQIKRGAYLINTARGAVVDTLALADAMKSGALGGAGLDVLEEEAAMHADGEAAASDVAKAIVEANNYLINHPRVIVTPHVAFDTREAIERILDTTAANIIAFASGKPQNLVQLP